MKADEGLEMEIKTREQGMSGTGVGARRTVSSLSPLVSRVSQLILPTSSLD